MQSDIPMPDNVVDMCKFHCDGINEEIADDNYGRTSAGVISTLKSKNLIRFDSYVIWKWTYSDAQIAEDDHLPRLAFMYGIVYRGFSNIFTTDSVTKLPKNRLHCDNYVHFNAGTTVVWNVPGVGPMVWMYDPLYTKKENYRIDPQTMDLEVIREDITYADIDVRVNERGETVKIVEDGKRFESYIGWSFCKELGCDKYHQGVKYSLNEEKACILNILKNQNVEDKEKKSNY
jgi:hypothetical protein